MNKELFFKGLKYATYTFALMFLAPTIIYQAFKNQTHPLYVPVLILGIIVAISAISLGFYTIRIFMKSLFND